MRALAGYVATLGSLLLLAAGCEAKNVGDSPPVDSFFFPAGVLLDPTLRVEADSSCSDGALPPRTLPLPGPRYLYVSNGNNDRSYNAGALMAIDLQAFWEAWYDPHRDDPAQAGCLEALDRAEAAGSGIDDALRAEVCDACAARDPLRGGLDPYCHDPTPDDESSDGRCVLPPGSFIDEDGDDPPVLPCRRLPLVPHVAECDERSFVISSVNVGDFATTLAASVEPDGHTRLWLPVRGDPSVTYVDVEPERGASMLQCDQGTDELDALLCGDSHRLDALRNDPDLDALDREPFNALIWERDPPLDDPAARGQRLAFVAHSDGNQLSMIDLDGVRGGSVPAIVDLVPLYETGAGGAGGFGLATRPCFDAGMGPLGAADPEPNMPVVTQGCTRPLVYTSQRFGGRLASFTASGLEVGAALEDRFPATSRTNCSVSVDPGCDATDVASCSPCEGQGCIEVYAGQYCATPDQIGQPCAVECEPQVRGSRLISPTLLLDTSLRFSPLLGDIAFADPRGDQLLVLQTNPGALLSLDTSLGADGEPLDVPSAPPVEICAEPSRMKIYTERDDQGTPLQRYALITCFRAALVYVVDLEALRVVDAIVVGTGPHDLAVDDARQVAYVINNLEFSISVIDLSRRRSTRFQEMARLGLQDPFSQ